MTHEEFQAYISSRMAAENAEEVAADLGVSRTTLYNWKNGEEPSRMALALAEKAAALSDSES